MGYIKDLEYSVIDYMNGDYEIIETETLPTPENVSFGRRHTRLN